MPEEPVHVNDELRQQLVAYLDGELDAGASQQIEERLATDPQLRIRLQRLDRTWEMLDELESPQLGEVFAQSTLEMVTVAAAEEAERVQAEAPHRRRRRWAIVGGGLLAAAAAGFLVGALLAPDPNRELIRDLPVLENLDRYCQIDDIEFLRMLQREGLFAEEESDDGQDTMPNGETPTAKDPSGRPKQ
jgi:hypothetical protein